MVMGEKGEEKKNMRKVRDEAQSGKEKCQHMDDGEHAQEMVK